MVKEIKGKVIAYGDNVDTDVIIPARYLNTSVPAELAAHCMEDIDPTFIKRVKSGTILAAGANFGCGSSREHAPIAIKASGVSLVVAKSFARIFYRNAVNTGLPIVEYGGKIDEGDELTVNFEKGEIFNATKNERGVFPPFPPFLQEIIESGGLLESLSKKFGGAK